MQASWSQSMLIGRADTALYGHMELHYQPIHSLSDGRLEAVEALVRWRHPVRGLVSPVEFIPVAERTGVIHPLGRWVIDTACEQLHRWRTQLPQAADLSIAINVSPSQLPHVRLVEDLRDALERYRLPPAPVVIEITESAFAHETVDAGAALADLQRLGVRLAMDDFGTGHSSLTRLRELPFDSIKIDQSFIAILGDAGDPLVEGIVGVARSLGLETVAEGIEETSQMRFAARYGCTGCRHNDRRPVPVGPADAGRTADRSAAEFGRSALGPVRRPGASQ